MCCAVERFHSARVVNVPRASGTACRSLAYRVAPHPARYCKRQTCMPPYV
jgi:hypothetical protein